MVLSYKQLANNCRNWYIHTCIDINFTLYNHFYSGNYIRNNYTHDWTAPLAMYLLHHNPQYSDDCMLITSYNTCIAT